MLKCNCLNLLILRLILDSYYYYDDDDINNNNNNKNEGIINLSFQYNTQFIISIQYTNKQYRKLRHLYPSG